MHKRSLLVPLVLLLTLTGCPRGDETGRLQDFEDFLDEVKAADYNDFESLASTEVRDRRAFEEMRKHILEMYDGARWTGSFFLDGQIADCITIDSQPSVRLLGLGQADREAPDSAKAGPQDGPGDVPSERRYADSPLALGNSDEFGNPIRCEPGSVPITRITLDKLATYETLRHFFSKGQDGLGFFPVAVKGEDIPRPEESANARRYAYTIQYVTNYGGNSWLNLWNPSMGSDGTMSLSQHWYSAGSGGGNQTLEGGWQVLPSKYNTSNAVLFTYWTADNYQSTGCYNLDCAGFVQTNGNWYLGGIWSAYSTTGGTQWGFELQYKKFGANWWLFLKGPGDYEAVGYYPGSIYGSGPMVTSASEILYGGETATSGVWPEMGSGEWANQGWQRAAFQNTIFYIPRNENNGTGVWASLTKQEPASTCYTLDLTPASSGGSWGTYFYFGGPGGNGCNS